MYIFILGEFMKVEEIGAVIRIMRQTQRYSQQDFSSMMEVNQSTISRIENGDQNLSFDLYIRCLEFFKLELKEADFIIEQTFHSILEACLNNDSQAVKERFDWMNNRNSYSIIDFLYLKIASVFMLSHFDRYTELVEVAELLSQLTFLFTPKMTLYFHMVKAYALLHQQKHEGSIIEFQKAYEVMVELNIKEPILYIIYGLNNISMRRYGTALICLNEAYKVIPQDISYGYHTVLKHLGTLHVYAGNYEDAIPFLEEFYNNKELLTSTFYFKQQLDSFLGVSYLELGNYEEAKKYLLDGVKEHAVESITETCYYLSFYLLRLIQDKDQYEHYYKQLQQEPFYQNETVQKMMNALFQLDGVNLDSFIKYFNLIKEQVLTHNLKYVFSRTIFSLYGESIWNKRQYKHYKSYYDILFRSRFNNLNSVI
jgi:transcriptional regulator with XRE-family HTH domain